MRITALHSQADIDKAFQEQAEREVRAIVRDLQYIGEQVVTEARTGAKQYGKDYLTQTGNLRSSIGYVVTLNGRILADGGFQPLAGSESGEEGASAGKAYAEEVASSTPGLALTVVAGMNYASHLHNMGYDVLDSAELIAQQLMDNLKEDRKK